MTTSTKHQCEALRADGQRCESFALLGGQFCFSHEPSIEAERIAVRRRGGRNHGAIPRLRKYLPPEARELYGTLERAFVQIHEGKLDPKVGNALANVAKAMVATLSVSKTEYLMLRAAPNIEKLEARVNQSESQPSAWERVTSELPMVMSISRKIDSNEPLTPEEEQYLAKMEKDA